MKTKRILLMLAFAAALVPGFAQNPGSSREKILSFFKNISEYDSKCSQEKVYLHLDNNAYFFSEKIYFKAYVVRASTLRFTDLSKVLYVELLDDDGNLVIRKNYEISEGQVSGYLPLDGLLRSGFYEVRAFTRAMLNWDGDYCFSRLIPVYETKDTLGTYSSPFMKEKEYNPDIPVPRKEPATLRSDSAQHNGLFVEFYPEGGARVEGLEQQIAYRVTDKKGLPVDADCYLYGPEGNVISTTHTEHEGMGSFILPQQSGECRVVFDDGTGERHDFRLPAARMSGIVALATQTADSLNLDISATSDLEGKLVGISVTCRGAACYFDTLRLGKRQAWGIAAHYLHYGINQVTFFDDEGRILWERLVWKKPQWPVTLTVRQNETQYQPFAPVVLDMKLADRQGNPCNAYFSLAVHDVSTEQNGTDITANADLLLASDIKGFVYRPEYYFESDDEQHRRALDLLLMVQGWRRYDWNEMSGVKPFKLVQPVEEGQLLCGYLLSDNRKRLAMAGARLEVNIYTPNGKASGSCITDSSGGFALMPPKYYNWGIGRFRTYVGDKEKSVRLVLDRCFAPAVRTLDPREFFTSAYSHEPQSSDSVYFSWNDTISKGDIRLAGAVVKGKRRDNTSSGRKHWMGGEDFARRNCDIYYNIPYETMRYCDKGEDTPLLWDLLKAINNKFDYFYTDYGYEFTYKNWPVNIIVDNQVFSREALPRYDYTLFANEVSGVYFSTKADTQHKIAPVPGADKRPSYTMFIYLNDDPELIKVKGKAKVVHFPGYNVDEGFEGPDYRKRDLPDSNDFRRTLYWNPDVLTDENGRASVVFYSNARPGVKLGITARAVLPDGSILDFSR